MTEAKLKPKRDEIIEWFDRVELGMKQSGERHFDLLYGRGASPLLSAFERLCRIAKEAGGNREKFYSLVNQEQTADVNIVLSRLQSDPFRSLLRAEAIAMQLSFT